MYKLSANFLKLPYAKPDSFLTNMTSKELDDIESYHKTLLLHFNEEITLHQIGLLRKALRCVHQEVVKRESVVATEVASTTRKYSIDDDIKNQEIRVYTNSSRFVSLQYKEEKPLEILSSYSSIKDYFENETEKVSVRLEKNIHAPGFLEKFGRRCIELLLFYRETYGITVTFSEEADSELYPFVKYSQKKLRSKTVANVKVSDFKNGDREFRSEKAGLAANGDETPSVTLYVCYYWTHLNTIGKATIQTDSWENEGRTNFNLVRSHSKPVDLNAVHLKKSIGNEGELYISVLFEDNPATTNRLKPVYTHMTLNGTETYLAGVYSSSRENKRLAMSGGIVCVAYEKEDFKAAFNAPVHPTIFNFLFQNRFEITESDLIRQGKEKLSKSNLYPKRSLMLSEELVGQYEGHFFNISGDPSLNQCVVTIQPSGQAVMVLSEPVGQSEYQLYFKKHLGDRVIIGHILTDSQDESSKNQRKISNSRAHFILSSTKESGVIRLKGIYAGVEKNAVNTVISGRIYLQQKVLSNATHIVNSIPLKEIDKINLASPTLQFLFGFTDSNLTDLGLYHANPDLFLPPPPLMTYKGDFVCCSYYERIDEGKTDFFVEICPLKITSDGKVFLKGQSGEFSGTASLRDSELNISVLHAKSSIYIVGNVHDVKENRTPCVSIWRNGHNPEARAEVLIRVTDERLFYEKSDYKKVNLRTDIVELVKISLNYSGVVSFLRGNVDRVISLPQKTDIFFPRASKIRRAHFFSACYLAANDSRVNREVIEDYLQRSYVHGFAVTLIYLDKLKGIDDQISKERVHQNKKSILRDQSLLKKEISDGGALVGHRQFIKDLWRDAIPEELQQICNNKYDSVTLTIEDLD